MGGTPQFAGWFVDGKSQTKIRMMAGGSPMTVHVMMFYTKVPDHTFPDIITLCLLACRPSRKTEQDAGFSTNYGR